MPFESKSQNRLEIVNELMILIVGYCTAISVGWNLSANYRLYVGLFTILLIAGVILFNIARWLVYVIKYTKLNWRRFTNIRKRRQATSCEKANKLADSKQKE